MGLDRLLSAGVEQEGLEGQGAALEAWEDKGEGHNPGHGTH
jgi:hypothetical protein